MRKLILLLSILFISVNTYSQSSNNGSIRGFIYDKSSGEPIMFCNVFLKGTTIGASTDINGMYNISKVSVGNYTLVATYIGYDTTKINISLKGGQFLSQNLEIVKEVLHLDKIFKKYHLSPVFLKCVALMDEYEDLSLRPSYDIDILFKEEEIFKA